MTMKLLFVLPEYGPDVRGGIGTFYHHLIPSLLRKGCSVDVCIASKSVPPKIIHEPEIRAFYASASFRELSLSRLSHFAAVPALRETLANAFGAWESSAHGDGYDVVEVTDWGLMYVPWLIRDDGPPVVVQLHGSNGQVDYHDPLEGGELVVLLTRMLEAALLGRADELQSGGSANAVEWSRLLNREVHHIWPALRTDVESPGALPARVKPDSAGVVVGRIQSWKGPQVLCQAVALLGRSAPQLIWVGRDHPFRRLNQSMSEHLRASYDGIWGEKIIPIGELSREMIAGVQAAAKFVVVPSTWDVFNLTGAEAMRLGKVVICSEGAGMAGLIREDESGFLFRAGDAAKLADLLAKVAALPLAERMRIGQRARETILHELDPDRIAAQRLDRYLRLKATRPNLRRPHLWCNAVFDASITRPPFAFLNTLPLRRIMQHALKRSLNRLGLHR